MIHEKEYLCVELSIILPLEDSSLTSMTRPTSASQVPLLNEDQTPFPTPPNSYKIVLFQGAVPYTSLLDVWTQKGLMQNSLKLAWSRFAADKPPEPTQSHQRTEYIMMRGPRGKGQCPVA